MRGIALVVGVALGSSGCAGPCKKIAADRAALLARTEGVAGPSARIRVPLALANRLIAQVVAEQEQVPIAGGLGTLLRVVTPLRAKVQEVVLVPADAGAIGVEIKVRLDDDEGELASVRARTDVVASVEPGDAPAIAIAVRWDQLAKVDLELTDRARAAAGGAVAAKLPDAVRKRVPRVLLEKGGEKAVERGAELVYGALRETVLKRLGEITKIRIPVPQMPVTRVEVAPVPGDVPALDLLVFTQLPIRAAVGQALPATADAISLEVSGSAAAELANWSIAQGLAPQHYTRELVPAKGGAYVPHFDWRPDRGDKPMVVHMFRTSGSCAHFQVAAQPHVEVLGDHVRAYVANKELVQADASVAFAALANMKDAVSSTTSETKKAPAQRKLRIGEREVRARLVRATIGGGDLRAAFTVELGAAAPAETTRVRRGRPVATALRACGRD